MARAALILSVVVAALLSGCGGTRTRTASATGAPTATVAGATVTVAAASATTPVRGRARVGAGVPVGARGRTPAHARVRVRVATSAGVSPSVARDATAARRRPAFVYRAAPLSSAMRALMRGRSWHPGCPVGLGALRYIRIGYWDFAGRPRVGGMVVSASVVGPLRRVFSRLYAARFPIRRMRPVDAYGGSDYASIQADNTSSFNCRDTTGATTWSQHAFGLAIDINPIENPYVYTNGATTHLASRPYLNRHDMRPGMAVAGGTLVRAFDAVGWGWGGRWPLPTDYQHFSANGR